MKQIINKSIQLLFLTLVVAAFTGCLKNEDLITDGVRTGGLVKVTGTIPYKLGFTPTFDIVVDATGVSGESIKSIKVYKKYHHNADTTETNTVLFSTLDVAGENVGGAGYTHTFTMTWADLIADLVFTPATYVIPTDEATAAIGDYFTFSYEVVMNDGKTIYNNAITTVSIANLFAGTYNVELRYFHPTAGGSYPDDPYGGVRKLKLDLTAQTPYDCTVWFGVWTANLININIDVAGVVTITFNRADAVSGDPNDATKVNSYDPVTGVIKIYYYYPGAGGNRIFWEYFTPV